MKKVLFLSLLMLGLVFGTTPARADILVVDIDLTDIYTNPGSAWPPNPVNEGFWLGKLLGFTVPFIYKYEGDTPPYSPPAAWTYAVLKYGVGEGQPGPDVLTHWAIQDDGDFILELGDIAGLPTEGLSHVSYFGQPIPEPATMLLLGSGLIGLAGVARRRFKK